MQVIGLGTQDDFAYAREFRETGGLEGVTMLWDPSFATWAALGVQANSQMMLVSPDLQRGTNLIYGFDDDQRQAILGGLADLR